MSEYDATEQAYKNGKERMREVVLEKLQSMKKTAIGPARFALDDAIQAVKKMEVRP